MFILFCCSLINLNKRKAGRHPHYHDRGGKYLKQGQSKTLAIGSNDFVNQSHSSTIKTKINESTRAKTLNGIFSRGHVSAPLVGVCDLFTAGKFEEIILYMLPLPSWAVIIAAVRLNVWSRHSIQPMAGRERNIKRLIRRCLGGRCGDSVMTQMLPIDDIFGAWPPQMFCFCVLIWNTFFLSSNSFWF